MLRGSLFSDLLCYLGSAHPTPSFTSTEGEKARRQARQGRRAPGRGRGRQCARLASAPSCRPAQGAVGGHVRRITHGGARPRPAQRRWSAPLRSPPKGWKEPLAHSEEERCSSGSSTRIFLLKARCAFTSIAHNWANDPCTKLCRR